MIEILRNRNFARLFAAHVVALMGTGLMTVALGLLAFELASESAGVVLGMAYAIKMIAYVGLSPFAAAIVTRLPRKSVLIGMDVVRASVALCLPIIDSVWQIYALIFVLQAASATFTPAFQATIPDILPDEGQYTRALSLSRLAYDLENLIAPTLAGLLLLIMDFHWLFTATSIGFILSALLVASAAVPKVRGQKQRPFRERVTRGLSIYLATPRLRGLLAFNMTAAAGGAFVLVNTVVIVRSVYGLREVDLAMSMAAFGAGSVTAALMLPWALDRRSDRQVMSLAALFMAGLLLAVAGITLRTGPLPWLGLLLVWSAIGFLFSAILTPSGRLLRRSAHPADRPAVFTAQFALSHACWLLTYPLAGWSAKLLSLPVSMGLLGALGLVAAMLGRSLWPEGTSKPVLHTHPELPEGHEHLKSHAEAAGHSHVVVIDDLHRAWPR